MGRVSIMHASFSHARVFRSPPTTESLVQATSLHALRYRFDAGKILNKFVDSFSSGDLSVFINIVEWFVFACEALKPM